MASPALYGRVNYESGVYNLQGVAPDPLPADLQAPAPADSPRYQGLFTPDLQGGAQKLMDLRIFTPTH